LNTNEECNSVKAVLFIYIIVFATGCDKIDGPYSESQVVSSNEACSDTLDTSFVYSRQILLEEFTGHTCQGCPAAAAVGQQLKATYGEKLVIVSIHSGSFAEIQNNPDGSYAYDFRTTEGTAIATDFGIIDDPYPAGMIDRKAFSGNNNFNVFYLSWATKLALRFAEPPVAAIQLKTSFVASDSTIKTTVKCKFLVDKDSAYNVCVYLMEDSIVNWQTFPSGAEQADYVHNHVFRGTISGTYGISLGNSFTAGEIVQSCVEGKIKHLESRPEHYYVVAFVYNTISKEVVQAIEQKLIP